MLATVLVGFGELAVEPLLAALNSASSLNVRVWSAQVLGKIGDLRAVASLLARIHDRADALRTSVANALGDLRDARAVRPLIDSVLRDPSATVRAQAAAALGRIRDLTAAVPLLVGALGDLEHWVQLRALEAIEAIAPNDTLQRLRDRTRRFEPRGPVPRRARARSAGHPRAGLRGPRQLR